jgi:steroid delta-isomerase-like uncharacterized protein
VSAGDEDGGDDTDEEGRVSDQNRLIARRFLRAFADGDVTVLEQIVDSNVVDHNARPDTKPGRQGLIDVVTRYRAGFPDMAIAVDQVIAEGDRVAAYGTVAGTNTGPLLGAPPTGKRVTFAYMDMYRIADGLIVETWHVEDIFGMFGQLGLMKA